MAGGSALDLYPDSKEALALAVLDGHWAAERRGWASVLSNQTEQIRGRLQEIFDEEVEQVELVDEVIAEALERGDVTVTDARGAARSIVAQLEGQVLLAKLYNCTGVLDTLWTNALSLLGATTAGARARAGRP